MKPSADEVGENPQSMTMTGLQTRKILDGMAKKKGNNDDHQERRGSHRSGRESAPSFPGGGNQASLTDLMLVERES